MKLIRFCNLDNEKPGVQLKNGSRIDVSGFGEDFDENFFDTGGIERLGNWLKDKRENCPIIAENERLGVGY
ncbi:MAG: hypothetical protein HKN31_05700 [Pricia sp.]|nr:hypothetical protein [Pricia sp.]